MIDPHYEIRPYWVIIAIGIASCLVFFENSFFIGFAVTTVILLFLEPVIEGDFE